MPKFCDKKLNNCDDSFIGFCEDCPLPEPQNDIIPIYQRDIQNEIRKAKYIIRQANKGICKPIFVPWRIIPKGDYITLQLPYITIIDGKTKRDYYNIAL